MVVQCEMDFVYFVCWGWLYGGLVVQLGQFFVVGELGNVKVLLWYVFDVEQLFFVCGVQQWQVGVGVDI